MIYLPTLAYGGGKLSYTIRKKKDKSVVVRRITTVKIMFLRRLVDKTKMDKEITKIRQIIEFGLCLRLQKRSN